MNKPSLLMILLCIEPAASTALAPDLQTTLLACRVLTDATVRLACYDREMTVLAATASALRPEQTFGLSRITIAAKESPAARREEISEIESRVVSLRSGAAGRSEFTLENGQFWKCLDVDCDPLLREGDIVKLTRGALNSHWMTTPSGRSCKVTRLR